jgi:hypothetical protein
MVPAGADKVWAEDSGGAGPVLVLLHEGVGEANSARPPCSWSATRTTRR